MSNCAFTTADISIHSRGNALDHSLAGKNWQKKENWVKLSADMHSAISVNMIHADPCRGHDGNV